MGPNGKVLPARFEANSWNVFERTLNGTPRTNNAVESVHATLNQMVPKANMPLYQCLLRIQKLEDHNRSLQLRYDLLMNVVQIG